MKLTAESTVINDNKLNTNIDNAQTSADNAQTSADNAQTSADNAQSTANTATTKADNAQGTANTAVTKADNAQTTADNAQTTANTAVSKADTAQATANSAKNIADNTAQYFWFTSSGSDTGAHISEKTQAQFVANPSGGNLLARSNGIAIREGLTELATFTNSGVSINQGGAEVATFGATARIGKPTSANTGNVFIDSDSVDIRKGADVLATFGTDGMQIGKDSEKHIEVLSNAFNVYDEDGSIPFQVSTTGSLKTLPHTRWATVSASTTTSTTIYYRGTLVDNRVYFGVATSGKPSTSANVVLTNPDTAYVVTVSGVQFTCYRYTDGYIFCYIKNNNSASRVWLINFTQSYRETLVKENNHILSAQGQTISTTDTTGTCGQITLKTYGGIAHLCIGVYGSSVANGGIIYQGTLSGLVPVDACYFMGFASGIKLCVGHLTADGTITIYNVSGSTLSTTASSMAWLSATYIMKE